MDKGHVGNLIDTELDVLTKPGYVKDILEYIKIRKHVDLEKINLNRNKLVLNNGTLDLSNWKDIRFHKDKFFRDDFSTICFDCNYDTEAQCPEFMKYLSSTFTGYEENINIVQELFGYSLSTSVKFEKIFIFYGEGSSGKSVLVDTLKTLIGRLNVSTVPMGLLDKSFLRASIKDKLLNFSTEEGSSIIKDTSWIKAISSGDPIEAQFKMRDSFNFDPFCKLVYAMNDLPQIENFDKALSRRFMIIPFRNIFDTNKDISLKEGKLHKEMDGILQFALQGLRRLAEQNEFSHSESMQELLNNYRSESNHVERFADNYIVYGNDESHIEVKKAYNYYVKFCKENGEKPFRNSEFCKIVRRKFELGEKREQRKINGKTTEVFNGLVLIDEIDTNGEKMPINNIIRGSFESKKPDINYQNLVKSQNTNNNEMPESINISTIVDEIW